MMVLQLLVVEVVLVVVDLLDLVEKVVLDLVQVLLDQVIQ
jgi:hypothetical protein